MKNLVIMLLLCPILAFAQKDWHITTTNNTITCVPKDLPSNKEFKIIFYKIDLGSMDKKAWITQHAKDQQPALGQTTKSWKIKSEKQGEWSASNEYKPTSGGKLAIGYETGTLSNGDPYVYQLFSSPDLGILIKYGLKVNKLKPYAEKELMALQLPGLVATTPPAPSKPDAPTTTTSTSAPEEVSTNSDGLVSASVFKNMSAKKCRQYVWKHIRTQPNQGVKPAAIETVLVDIGYSVTLGTVTTNTYLLLKDGTVYTDCETPIQDLNVKMSKQLEGPDYKKHSKWSHWKKERGQYYIQNPKNQQWEVLDDVEKALPGKKGERLNDTFWTFSGSQMYGSYKGYYKLMPDGRFEIYSSSIRGGDMGDLGTYVGVVNESDKTGSSGTTVVSSTDVGGGVTNKKNDGNKNTGTYYIDGYSIEFKHDNGWVHRELFHFPAGHKRKYIQIAHKVYWIKDYD